MKATSAQIHYIECLAIDLGLDRKSRNAHVGHEIGREVKALDELSMREASDAIQYLFRLKEDANADA